jgi:uncharacterized protein YndB with AHSA1/START domain
MIGLDGCWRQERKRIYGDLVVGIDAHRGRRLQTDARDVGRAQLGRGQERARRCLRVGPARPDGGQIVVRLDDVTVARENQNPLLAGDKEPRFELAEESIAAPLARQLNRRASGIAMVVLELALETFEEGESVSGGARKADEDFVVKEAPDLAGAGLHHQLAHGHLTVGAHGDYAVPAHREDGGTPNRPAIAHLLTAPTPWRCRHEARNYSIGLPPSLWERAGVAMAGEYHFDMIWRFDVPIDRVWKTLTSTEEWPRWWKNCTNVETIEPGGPDGVGTVQRFTIKSELVYALRFQIRTTRLEEPRLIKGDAQGNLEGTVRWQLTPEADGTRVHYNWDVRPTEAWMQALSPILRPIFAWNHQAVMRKGGQGLARMMGANLVAEEYR